MQKLLTSGEDRQLAGVLLPVAVDQPFDYSTGDTPLEAGLYVTVPFRGKSAAGVVWGPGEGTVPQARLKAVGEILSVPPMLPVMREFIDWVAHYTMAPLGMVLRMALSVPAALSPPARARKPKPIPALDPAHGHIALSPAQETAATALRRAVRDDTFSVTLLDGVTGSGKTEVYFEAIAAALQVGRQVLVLLPEIALSAQFVDRFQPRFGARPALWHSELTPAQRRETWRGVAEGKVQVVLGARSALFLPYTNLGLIVIDEENDGSFKQEEGVIYHARDMAIVRAKLGDFATVLVSATPSLETMHNVQQGRYTHLTLPARFGGATLPDIALIDLRLEKLPPRRFVSETLVTALTETIAAGEQALLFLNRRGYAPLTLCRTCGHRMQCPNCTAWLVDHRAAGKLTCHYCGHTERLPRHCPKCDAEDSFAPVGPGVERIAEEVAALFPTARLAIMTSDLMQAAGMMQETLRRIRDEEVDIIVGTQIIAKGHHFPKLTLVGVIDADLGLSGGDLRAGERTYQLLQQVSGRAGRAVHPGRSYIQTYVPEHPVMQALVSGDRDHFLAVEAEERQAAAMPPFTRLAALIVSSEDRVAAENAAIALSRAAPVHPEIRVLGPAPAPIALLRNRTRYRLLLKVSKTMPIQPVIKDWLSRVDLPNAVRVQVDIDPYSFM
jgi:primosomal protein N' (replication factor Y)